MNAGGRARRRRRNRAKRKRRERRLAAIFDRVRVACGELGDALESLEAKADELCGTLANGAIEHETVRPGIIYIDGKPMPGLARVSWSPSFPASVKLSAPAEPSTRPPRELLTARRSSG